MYLQEILNIGVYRLDDYSETENSPEESQLLDDFAKLLRDGGSTVTTIPEIQRIKFKKNIINCAFSSFSTLTGYTLHAVFRTKSEDSTQLRPVVDPVTGPLIDENTIPTIRAILEEIVDVGRAYGFPDTEESEKGTGTVKIADAVFNRIQRLHTSSDSRNMMSMLLDAQSGSTLR